MFCRYRPIGLITRCATLGLEIGIFLTLNIPTSNQSGFHFPFFIRLYQFFHIRFSTSHALVFNTLLCSTLCKLGSFIFPWNPSARDTPSFNQRVWRKSLSGRKKHTFITKWQDLKWEHWEFKIFIGRRQFYFYLKPGLIWT